MNSLNVWSIFQFPVSQFDVIQSRYVLFICCHFQHRCHSLELSGVTTNYVQGITLSEASLHFFFLGLYLRKGSFPRSLYFLPTQTGFSGSCAPESATNPIGHSHLYEPTVLLQTWLAPQASGDWHSSRSTNQRYKEISTYDIESNKQPDNGQALKKAHPSAGNRELNWCIKISPTYVLVCRLHARRGRIHYSCQQHVLKCFYFY